MRRAAGRVAQDVNQQRLRVAQDVLCASGLLQAEHIALQGLGLVVGAVLQEGHAHGLQGIVAGEQVGLLRYLHHVGGLAQ